VGVEGKTAFVTGAGSGIGRGIASRLAADGARVVVADIEEAAGKEVAQALSGAGGLFVPVDVTDSGSVTEAAQRAVSELGQVDILVNCAGTDVVKPFLDTDEDLWHWLIALNLTGVLCCTKAFLPSMVERGYGRIVNIASDAGRVGSAGEAVYSAAKGGVIAFTKTIAREVARKGVTANTVCPGPTDTPALQKNLAQGGEKYIAALTKAIPVGRLGKPADVAAAVAMFAAEDAGFITGQTLSVSGGMSMS
jgi:2-hydroxycyclohexanecarboxyl-CoA dehydrogenase